MTIMIDRDPFYETPFGQAYLGDARTILAEIPSDSVNLIMTSPPFALERKKEYGNVDAKDYIKWFIEFAVQFKRILREDGSLVIDIGGTWNKGTPTRSLYHFELLIALVKYVGFYLAQEFYWLNPSKLPTPAEWVTVRRIRVKDAVDPVWWLSKTPWPKADNRTVLWPYSQAMEDLLERGYKAKLRPSGHDISDKFSRRHDGAIPPNLLPIPNTESNSYYQTRCRSEGLAIHPARFPAGLPQFFIEFLTEEGDLIVDPFAGSNVTGEVAERLRRRWIAIEIIEEYLEGSKFRFEAIGLQLPMFANQPTKVLREEDQIAAEPTSREIPPEQMTANDNPYYLEQLTKAVFQAGFSRKIIHDKWTNFEKAFDDFDIEAVAGYDEQDVDRLLADDSIVRNQRKIRATIHNARVMQELIAEHGSFYTYLRSLDELDYADLCKELRQRFRNLGPASVSVFLRNINEEVQDSEQQG
jgi:site-specific DNA-methyltransferase (cytosine-N4-specific)